MDDTTDQHTREGNEQRRPTEPTDSHDITAMLNAWELDDKETLDRLISALYSTIHRMAHNRLRAEHCAIQTTELVNEAYLRLSRQKGARWKNRAHFFGITAQMMRRILVDAARARRAEKRGGDQPVSELDADSVAAVSTTSDIVAVDDALRRLTRLNPRQGQLVELRYFGGLTLAETAQVLGVSVATVKREWSTARAWLRQVIPVGL